MQIETHTIKLDIRNKKTETLFEGHVGQLDISTFWDSHGTSVPFPGRNQKHTERIRDCNVKIIKETYDIHWEHSKATSHEAWLLEANGEEIPGDVWGYKGTDEKLHVKLCVGNG